MKDTLLDYINRLNPEQKQAATHKEGPLLILAGAGSGKTSTMTHRIAYLIQEQGISPYNILAVTFTNKAAKEMRERLETLMGEDLNMWILTFHSACLRILRMHGDKIGYGNNFVIYDTNDQKTVIKNCIKELGVDDKKFTSAYVLSIISHCKEKGISPGEYAKNVGKNFKEKMVAEIYNSYEKILKSNNAMDFDDLILRTVQLFTKNEDVLNYFQNKFQYIMVDEYQDTNYMQYRFIKLLAEAHNNICVVGDDDQCIYQWRGADINNILDFEKDFRGTKVIKLEQNYRSHANILAAAHSVIQNNKGRKSKKLWTDKEKGEKVKYFRAEDDKDEARYIAREIELLRTGDRKYSDFAVLYRTNAQSRRFEDVFISRGIPYRVLSGFRYYDRKEVKDLMAYMRLVENPIDDLSMIRIINEPKRGIGEKTVEKLKVMAALRSESLLDLLKDPEILEGLPGKSGQSLREMVDAVRELSEEKDNLKVSDIYDGLLVRTGYLAALEQQNTIESESRIENLLEFKSVIYDYEKEKQDANEMGSLGEFMETISLMAEVDNHDTEENAVVLMTLHSAKGLEFPVVFIPGMEDGLFPSWRSFDKQEGLEEERRLCYVGMTRAKERLYLTNAACRTLYGKTEVTRESMFLKELDKSLVEGDYIPMNRGYDRYSGYENESFDYEDRQIFRPFAQMNSIKANKTAKPSLSDIKLATGDKVNHNKFGNGEVICVDGNTVTVNFDTAGVKKLALNIAPLTILNERIGEKQ
ncbi:MAG: ATP-dependent helicase [Anaerovoracaceae bacterium]|jgi:DNA helicase-2/ATP-dependent DNA helicase PcrA